MQNHLRIISVLNYLKWTLMDINHNRCRPIYYSFNGICADVYDRLDYETHTTDKTMRYL